MNQKIMKVKDCLSLLRAEFGSDCRVLFQYASGMSREQLLMNMEQQVTGEALEKYLGFIERRKRHEPVAYITGCKEFYSRDFDVSPAVLIPRPESELFIDYAATFFPDKNADIKILELGIGSGAVLITLLLEYANATGVGIDISEAALEVATKNAVRYFGNSEFRIQDSGGNEARIRLLKSDWLNEIEGKFNLIISNPPYVAYKEKSQLQPDLAFEPENALFAEKEGLACYEEIAHNLADALAIDGIALFEIGQGKLKAVKQIFIEEGFEFVGCLNDLAGIPRCAAFRRG